MLNDRRLARRGALRALAESPDTRARRAPLHAAAAAAQGGEDLADLVAWEAGMDLETPEPEPAAGFAAADLEAARAIARLRRGRPA